MPVPLDGSSPLLPPDRAAQLRRGVPLEGTLETDGTRYLYAARLVKGKGYILLRPASSTNSAWRPHIEGLVIAAARDRRARRTDRVPARTGDRPSGAPCRRGHARPGELDVRAAARPGRGRTRARAAGGELQRGRRRALEGTRGGASVPALGQPRAEDAADRDPRLRGRARRGCPAGRGDGGDHPPRVAAASSGSSATCSTWGA